MAPGTIVTALKWKNMSTRFSERCIDYGIRPRAPWALPEIGKNGLLFYFRPPGIGALQEVQNKTWKINERIPGGEKNKNTITHNHNHTHDLTHLQRDTRNFGKGWQNACAKISSVLTWKNGVHFRQGSTLHRGGASAWTRLQQIGYNRNPRNNMVLVGNERQSSLACPLSSRSTPSSSTC